MRDVTHIRLHALWRLSLLLPLLLLAACDSGTASAPPTAPTAAATTRPTTPTPTPPPVAAGIYYLTDKTSLVALNMADGSRRWSVALPKNSAGNLVATDRVIYIEDSQGVVAFRASDGAQMWSHPANGVFDYANGVIYCMNHAATSETAGNLIALNGYSGTPLWTTPLPISNGTITLFGGFALVQYSAMVAQGGPPISHLYAVDASSGKIAWKLDPADTGMLGLVFHGGTLYLPLFTIDANQVVHDQIHAYRLADGAPIWQTRDIPYFNHLIDADDTQLYIANQTNLTALNAATGATTWAYNLQNPGQVILVNDVLYAPHFFGSGQNPGMVALSAATGAKRWETWFGASNPYNAPPTVANGLVYIATRGAVGAPSPIPYIFAINATSGVGQWQQPMRAGYLMSAHGMLYTNDPGASPSLVFAINATSGALKWKIIPDGYLISAVVTG